MKNRYKVLISLVIIVILALAFYTYKRKQYLTLNPEDRAIIMKSFGKDSDGKGYSDEGHRLIMEDVKLIPGLSEQERTEFYQLYKNVLINKHKAALSENQETYFENQKKYNQSLNCWVRWVQKGSDRMFKLHLLSSDSHMGDNEALDDYLDILSRRYFSQVSQDKIESIINPQFSIEECKDFLK